MRIKYHRAITPRLVVELHLLIVLTDGCRGCRCQRLGRHLRGEVATGFAIVGHLQGPLEQETMSIIFVMRQRGLDDPVIIRAVIVIVSVSN